MFSSALLPHHLRLAVVGPVVMRMIFENLTSLEDASAAPTDAHSRVIVSSEESKYMKMCSHTLHPCLIHSSSPMATCCTSRVIPGGAFFVKVPDGFCE